MPLFARSTFDDFDYCADDELWDETADIEEATRRTPFAARSFALTTPLLDSATRADGYIVGGRIIWKKLLAGLFAPSELTYCPGYETRGSAVVSPEPAAFLWHHTGSNPTPKRPAPSLDICINGRKAGRGVTAVSGPLVPLDVGLDGHLWVICSGRANHAGTGHRPLEARMRQGLFPAGTARDQGLKDTGGWGGVLIGVEVENNGKTPFTPAQISTCVRIGLAAKRLGLSDAQAIGWDHQACTSRKIDLPAATHQSIIDPFLAAANPLVFEQPIKVDERSNKIRAQIAELRASAPAGPMSVWRKGQIAKLEAQLRS
jgi:hypothetical protein